jgi:hypothetical protein
MKRPKFKKCNEEQMKESLRSFYPQLREIYKRLSGLGMIGNIFSIRLNTFSDFMNNSLNMIDRERFFQDELDTLFLTVNG